MKHTIELETAISKIDEFIKTKNDLYNKVLAKGANTEVQSYIHGEINAAREIQNILIGAI